MFTHVTVELPRVIEAAGLPLVRDIIYERSIYFSHSPKKNKKTFRTGPGNPSLDTAWVVMVH